MPSLKDLSNKDTLLSPSILAADFGQLGAQVKEAQEAGAELLHIDVMDGHFVPNISIGIPVVESLKNYSSAIFDVHLMISDPLKYIDVFADAGADHITFHTESDSDISKTINAIKKRGLTAGLSVKPGTSIEALLPHLEEIDMILIMTVEPGFGGQSFMPDMLEKIRDLRAISNEKNLPFHIEVDGGIKAGTAEQVIEAGANILVAGTAFFRHRQGMSHASRELRQM